MKTKYTYPREVSEFIKFYSIVKLFNTNKFDNGIKQVNRYFLNIKKKRFS